MPKLRFKIILTAAAIACTAPLSMADKLDDIEKELVAASKKITSLSAKVTLEVDRNHGGAAVKSNGTGTLEYVRKAGKHYFRMELTNHMVTKFGEQERKMEQSSLTVSDGTHVYSLMEGMGQKRCSKTSADKSDQNPDPETTFKFIRKKFELKILPDDKVDGKAAYVIEGIPKGGASAMPGGGKTTFYFSKEYGFRLKMVNADPQGKPFMTMTITDLKAGASISPDRFKFTVPEGVRVIDQTKQP